MDKKYAKIITCQHGCGGTQNLCIPLILNECDHGGVVFMIYGGHVQSELEKIRDYNYEYVHHNGMKIGMYITRKEGKA